MLNQILLLIIYKIIINQSNINTINNLEIRDNKYNIVQMKDDLNNPKNPFIKG